MPGTNTKEGDPPLSKPSHFVLFAACCLCALIGPGYAFVSVASVFMSIAHQFLASAFLLGWISIGISVRGLSNITYELRRITLSWDTSDRFRHRAKFTVRIIRTVYLWPLPNRRGL